MLKKLRFLVIVNIPSWIVQYSHNAPILPQQDTRNYALAGNRQLNP